MKKCQKCPKAAVLHITELVDGEATALHLCESCAQEYLSTVPVGDSPSSFDDEIDFDDIISDDVPEAEAEDFDDDSATCPNCGITFREFRKQGRLGCPQDYVVFASELKPLLENIHSETEHIGKCPKRAPDSSQRQYELIRLRKELQSAVDSEQYETAAELRDQIASIESELSDA